jgi:LmbE family N-acetylglucosaminyl deacetylase
MMSNEEVVAVIVAHPDDEILAFGGVMARHAAHGDAVHILIMATGLAARSAAGELEPESLDMLRADARAAAKIVGAQSVTFDKFPDNRMDTVALLDVVKCAEEFLRRTNATTVYTHHVGDMNIDHTTIGRAVLTACRPLPGARVRRIYSGEILSSSEYALAQDRFVPTTYVDIDEYLDRKCAALECYRSEIHPAPHPRSVEAIRAQAALRGSECGMGAAEALRLLREIRL